jgi:predicted nucleotidyltransferase
MAKISQTPEAFFPELIQDYRTIFGNELVSVILFGSATGGEFRPGKSDINFMIVLSEAGIDQIEKAFGAVEKWRKQRVAVPLFLTETYVTTSLDVFPIEYLDLRQNHRLLFGKDVLVDLTFSPESVRLQCEREVKGKLLLLRKAFLDTAGKENALKKLIGRSLPAFVAIFRALLFLKGKEPSSEKREVIKQTCETFGLDDALFKKLLDVKLDNRSQPEGELRSLVRDYLREVQKLSRLIDAFGG